MRAALILLPLLLPESLVATLARGSGKRRAYYKPSAIESMSWFVDIQKASVCCCSFACFGISDLQLKSRVVCTVILPLLENDRCGFFQCIKVLFVLAVLMFIRP